MKTSDQTTPDQAQQIEKLKAEKEALEKENENLHANLEQKFLPSDSKAYQAETKRLEREAARQKVKSGETPVESTPVDPLDALLSQDLPESERAELWLSAIGPLEWKDSPEKALIMALELLKDYRLLPASKVGRKIRGVQITARLLLQQHFKKGAEAELVEPDARTCKPALTEEGRFFIEKVNAAFGQGSWIGCQDPRRSENDNRPDWEIPSMSVSHAASELYGRIALEEHPTIFVQGHKLVELVRNDTGKKLIEQVSANRMISLVERFVRPYAWMGRPAQKTHRKLARADAEPLLEIREELVKLPRLTVLANAPVLVMDAHGEPRIIKTYDSETGIYVLDGDVQEDIGLEAAVDGLLAIQSQFRFADEGDLSRAVAAVITPSLILGGLLGGRPAIDISEADKSQAGKAYRQDIIGAIYRETFSDIAEKVGGGVGSLDESFDTALLFGSHFIRIDNFRGELRSQKIESFLTQSSYLARVPHIGGRWIDPTRRLVYLTSNGLEATEDLANRASVCRIRKQEGRAFFDTLAWVHEHQAEALGGVFAVGREWIRRGRPRTNETRHDFRPWAQSLDWIVQHIFKLPPLMDGHRDLQARLSSPHLAWLRSLAIAVDKEASLDQNLQASDLVEICTEHNITIPMRRSSEERDAARLVGRIMAKVFNSGTVFSVDDYRVHREERTATGETHHNIKVYWFTKVDRAQAILGLAGPNA